MDEGISFVDLKATLEHFAHRFFRRHEDSVPSIVLSVHRAVRRDGRRVPAVSRRRVPRCKGTGWMEILGWAWSILRSSSIRHRPRAVHGMGFWHGPHRITMPRYGIPDIRLLYDGDMRFLEQFVVGRGGYPSTGGWEAGKRGSNRERLSSLARSVSSPSPRRA